MQQEILPEDLIINTARSLHDAGMNGKRIAELMKISVRRVHRLISKSYRIERSQPVPAINLWIKTNNG